MGKVKRLPLDRYEHGLLVRALYEEWQRMQTEGKPTDDMENLILMVIDVPTKKKIWEVYMMNELTYHREGDYLIPNLIPPESPRIGAWGIRRRDYLKKHHDGIYSGMLLSGKLSAHLEEIDREANEMFYLLMKQYAACEGVTEEMKAQNQMAWIRRMNGFRKCAEEIVDTDLIYK